MHNKVHEVRAASHKEKFINGAREKEMFLYAKPTATKIHFAEVMLTQILGIAK